jgi:hypothetical protein
MTDDHLEHGGHTYRVEGMTPMVEFHVARRMSAALVSVVIDSMRRGDKGKPARLIADGADAEALAVAEANVEGAKKLLEITLIDQGRTLQLDADAVR